MYVWIGGELILNVDRVVAVTDIPGDAGGEAGASAKPRTLIHLADGRVAGARSAKDSVVRKIREAHL